MSRTSADSVSRAAMRGSAASALARRPASDERHERSAVNNRAAI